MIAYQVKIHKKFSKYPTHVPKRAWTHWTLTLALSKVSEAVANRLAGIKNSLVRCLFISNWELNMLEFLSVSTNKILQKCISHFISLYLEKCVSTYVSKKLFTFLWGDLNPEFCPGILGTPCIKCTFISFFKRL